MTISHAVSGFMVAGFFAGTYFFGMADKAHSQQFKRITTEQEYLSAFGGKRLVNDQGGWVISTQDGRIQGEFGGQKFVGRWKWDSGLYCRNGRLGGQEIGSDCSLIEFDGSVSRVTAEQGKGRSITYRFD